MIDEKILLECMQRMMYKTVAEGDDHAKGYNDAINTLEDFVDKMPKIDPIFVKPHIDDLRDKLHDMEFERDFYKAHFEDLYRRKVEG